MLWIEWFRCVTFLRKSCSRNSTFIKLVLVLAGMSVRSDLLGVTSLVRTGFFSPEKYRNILHFFHSKGIKQSVLLKLWVKLVLKLFNPVREDGYLVFIADGLKAPKEGRKMPGVKSLHQESANNSKPSFIMDHSFQVISLLVQACGQYAAVPVLSRISEGVFFPGQSNLSLLDKLASWFIEITGLINAKAILTADAYYGGRSIILPLLSDGHHLITRLKTNCVAYLPADGKAGKRGRPREYGEKVKLYKLFNKPDDFLTAQSPVYGESGVIVKYRSINLMWRSVGRIVQFVLVSHPVRGNIVLMCTSLSIDPLAVIKLYGLRFKIEVSFKQAIHTLGTYLYHFRMRDMVPIKKGSGNQNLFYRNQKYMQDVQRKLSAYHCYVMLGCIAQGLLQHLALNHKDTVWTSFKSWLRTMRKDLIPSEFVVSIALRSSLPEFLLSGSYDSNLKKIILENANIDNSSSFNMAA
jgi:hypothetical protein